MTNDQKHIHYDKFKKTSICINFSLRDINIFFIFKSYLRNSTSLEEQPRPWAIRVRCVASLNAEYRCNAIFHSPTVPSLIPLQKTKLCESDCINVFWVIQLVNCCLLWVLHWTWFTWQSQVNTCTFVSLVRWSSVCRINPVRLKVGSKAFTAYRYSPKHVS